MNNLKRIHGTSSNITFDFEDCVIKGSGEFRASDKIDGFVVDVESLKYENGDYLSSDELNKLRAHYEAYKKSHPSSSMIIEFNTDNVVKGMVDGPGMAYDPNAINPMMEALKHMNDFSNMESINRANTSINEDCINNEKDYLKNEK